MRSDYNKVITDDGKHCGGGKYPRCRAGDEKRESMRSRRGWSEQKETGDNLKPLWRFMKSRVGKNWDKTYSEFCSLYDRRKLINKHVHDHIRDWMDTEFRYADFYVDKNGILQHQTWTYYRREPEPQTRFACGDGWHEKLSGDWFFCWNENIVTLVHVGNKDNGTRVYGYRSIPTLKKRQISKKEIKKWKLS